MLQAVDLTFGYGPTPVIRGVSLQIAGGITGLIGPNGSGKTTLLRLLAGTRQPASGRVLLDGTPLATLPRAAIARRMAVVPQETQLAFDYAVLEVVLMGRYVHLGAFAVEGPQDTAIARTCLAATGAGAFEARPFRTLSGGEKQRVIIAAALAQITSGGAVGTRGSVLLLDEPTAALDLGHQLALARLLRELHRDRGVTIVVCTHDLAFAGSLCSSVIMLRDGEVLASGGVDDVLTPARIRQLYDVEVEVARHAGSGRLSIVPTGDPIPGRRS